MALTLLIVLAVVLLVLVPPRTRAWAAGRLPASFRRRYSTRLPDDAAVRILTDPTFGTLTERQQNKQLRDAVLVVDGRQKARARRFTIGYSILATGLIIALAGLQVLDTRQTRDQARRLRDQARELYTVCTLLNTKVIDPILAGIDALTAPASERDVTDPATLARIRQANAARAQARTDFAGVRDLTCTTTP